MIIRRIGAIQLVAIALAGAATFVVGVLPELTFAYRSAELHIAIETTATIVAALAAFLIHQRFRRTGALAELILFLAFVLLALANAAATLSALGSPSGTLPERAVWVPLWPQLLAAAMLAAAALAPRRRLPPGTPAARIVPLAVAVFALVLLAALLLAPSLPTGIDPDLSPAESDSPIVVGATGMLVCQLAAMLLLAAASVVFTLRARESRDELLAWFALAATLGAFSHLNYFLFPSGYSDWVFTGDGFRLAVYLLVLVGTLRQIGFSAQAAADAAAYVERQRMARDLHDGLAQELALIATQAERLPGSGPEAESIVEASRMALADSRAAIMDLSRPLDEPFPSILGRVAGALAEARGARARLDLEQSIELPAEAERPLLLILSEAISNAVAHGGASEITVRLRQGDGVTFAVADNGKGFDPDSVDPDVATRGLGLENMRARAAQLGGELRITSGEERGTRIEVRLP